MKAPFRCWAEIDLGALRENLIWLRHQAGPEVKIITVVKADAYGHGLKQIAGVLMQAGTDVFGVANLHEAQTIRSVGKGWPILLLSACIPEEIDLVVQEAVMPTLSSLNEAQLFAAAARRFGKTVGVHVKIDTGMGRLGVSPDEAARLIHGIARLPGLELQGIYTHFAAVEDDPDFAANQREVFVKCLNEAGVQSGAVVYLHSNNSGGVLFETSSTFNTIRPGLLVYGIVPPGLRKGGSLLQQNLRPALAWKSRLSLVKAIRKGSPISYGKTFVTPRDMPVGVVTAGYGDGYMRSGSTRAQVLVRGRRCPVLGRITMDQIVVDLTAAPEAASGDEVVLAGKQGAESISITHLAEWCQTIPWEVLTHISHRVPRVYLGSHAS